MRNLDRLIAKLGGIGPAFCRLAEIFREKASRAEDPRRAAELLKQAEVLTSLANSHGKKKGE